MIAWIHRWECALQCSAIWTALVALFLIVRMESGNFVAFTFSNFTNGFVLFYLITLLTIGEYSHLPCPRESFWPHHFYLTLVGAQSNFALQNVLRKNIFQGRRRFGYDLHLGLPSLHLGFILKRSPFTKGRD